MKSEIIKILERSGRSKKNKEGLEEKNKAPIKVKIVDNESKNRK